MRPLHRMQNSRRQIRVPRWIARAYESLWRMLARLLGTNVRFLARNMTLVSLSHVIGLFRGLVTGYLVARLFPREMYGQYQFLLSVAGAVTVFGVPGIGNALGRAVARGERGMVLPVAGRQFLIALIGSLLLLGVLFFLPPQQAHLWPLFVVAAALFPAARVANDVFHALTVGKSRFDTALRATLTWNGAAVVATLVILAVRPSALLLYVTMIAFPLLAYAWFSRPLLDRTDPPASVGPIVRYGAELTLISLPSTLSMYVDKLLISSMLGLNQLAIFTIALLIPDQVKGWMKALLLVSFAVQARGEDTPQRRRRLLRAVGRMMLLFLIAILVYILLAPTLFALLFPNYPEAVLLSQLFSVTLLAIPSTLIGQYMEAQGMLPALRRSQWLSSAVFVLATVTLIPAYGLLGAVGARGILRLSYACCTWYFFLRTPLPVFPAE